MIVPISSWWTMKIKNRWFHAVLFFYTRSCNGLAVLVLLGYEILEVLMTKLTFAKIHELEFHFGILEGKTKGIRVCLEAPDVF